ncbi:MAG TPA: hypothetical protein VEJ22_05075, partial [Nitrospirota bacterium]|nr:hypothetical protein [Nitrospirota bacterium]
ASVPLVYATARRYTGKLASFTSLGLFALSPRLIYYSSELKQYSTDVVMTLLLLFIVPECLEERPKPRAFVALGVAGSFAIWISHPTLFVSAGILLTLGLAFALRKDSYRLLWVIGIGGLWTINLVLIYLISLQYLTANNTLLNFWSRGFAPLPPWSNFTWYYEALGGMLHDPAGLPMSAITVSLLLLGVLSYALRRWQLTFALLVPFLLTLIASAFRNYPFSGRLLLFLIPLLLLLLAEGVERVRVSLLRVNRPMAFVVSAFLVVYLFYDPVIVTYKRLRSPPMGEHIKPLLARVSRDRLGADSIYVYYGAGPAFEFYAPLYGFARNDYILGSSARNDPDKYLRDIDKLKGGRRVWFVFSHNCSWCAVNEQLFILEHLDKIGLRRSEFLSDAASLYLYDLTPLR